MVLSCRLLRSEAARAAAVNHTAVLNSRLAHVHVSGSVYAIHAIPTVSVALEVMSEDGANTSKRDGIKCHNSGGIVKVSAPNASRSVASTGARSISSLPLRYVPHSPQRLKYSHRKALVVFTLF